MKSLACLKVRFNNIVGKDQMDKETTPTTTETPTEEEPQILEEIAIEELSIDGICGVY
jgi:mycofactocin precursor